MVVLFIEVRNNCDVFGKNYLCGMKRMIEKVERLAIHFVGNKGLEEGVRLSGSETLFEAAEEGILKLANTSFPMTEIYSFTFDPDLSLNPIYGFVSAIFDDQSKIIEQSRNCARYLYEKSLHPKIKPGELYVIYFKDCELEGERMDAIGLFKSENKDTFLKVYPSGDGYVIKSETGVNINKLDKGCLIFNSERENGYKVAVVDHTNKGSDAHYWIDDFLHVAERKDDFFNTKQVLNICKKFVENELPKQFDATKVDQADILNRSVGFFRDNELFERNQFSNQVMESQEMADSFNRYLNEYERKKGIELVNSFAISEDAVKQQSRFMKSVIKLDNNFHIYVHGNAQYIRRGYDEELGMHYYQLFFKEEK